MCPLDALLYHASLALLALCWLSTLTVGLLRCWRRG